MPHGFGMQGSLAVHRSGAVISAHYKWASHQDGRAEGGWGAGRVGEQGGWDGTGKARRDEPVRPSSPGILHSPTPLAGPWGASWRILPVWGQPGPICAKISHSEHSFRS